MALFPALLKFWRGRRGLSQLDLAVNAGVSSRHVSFLESGRAKPSEPMALRLLDALAVPLRDQNEALRAAGFEPRFSEAPAGPEIDAAITQMLEQQEPFPLLVLSPRYEILRQNRAATRLFAAFAAEPAELDRPLDMISLVFDPALLRPAIVDWEHLAHVMLARLHRQALGGHPHAPELVARALNHPGVPKAWRHPDFDRPVAPSFRFRMKRGPLEVGFLNTITVFSAPQQITLEELIIESSFPLDDATRKVSRRLSKGGARRSSSAGTAA